MSKLLKTGSLFCKSSTRSPRHQVALPWVGPPCAAHAWGLLEPPLGEQGARGSGQPPGPPHPRTQALFSAQGRLASFAAAAAPCGGNGHYSQEGRPEMAPPGNNGEHPGHPPCSSLDCPVTVRSGEVTRPRGVRQHRESRPWAAASSPPHARVLLPKPSAAAGFCPPASLREQFSSRRCCPDFSHGSCSSLSPYL